MRLSRILSASARCGGPRRIAALFFSGLTFSLQPGAGLLAQTLLPAMHDARDPHAAYIAEASLRFGIPADWIRAVLAVESAGNIGAISSVGAMGLMQVMPETWAELRLRHRLGNDPFDPRDNILAGTAYLREMFDRYGEIGAMLAAYNAGPGRMDAFLLSDQVLPAETRAYVALLAPALGGAPLPGAGVAIDAPRDWREAPLFSGSMIVIPDAARLHSDDVPDVASTAPETRIDGLAPAYAQELFVARSGRDLAP